MALTCDTKVCPSCGVEKPAQEFSPSPAGGCGLHTYCKPCNSARANEWNKANRARRAEAARKYRAAKPGVSDKERAGRLRRTYGITPEEYDEMLVHQGGVCAICLKPPAARRLAVDHDHRTGLIRGLLCAFCNFDLLGKSGDKDPGKFLRAADYLEDPPAVAVLGEHVVPSRPKRKKSQGVRRTSHGAR